MKDSQANMIMKANEREEGEIIDDYELISSDEEICMRQRIQELEAENEEIEQIAVISRSYDIDRAAQIPTDVSSISSTEFKTPKKRKRHRNKDHKKKPCHHHHSHHHRHHTTSQQHGKKMPRTRKTRCKKREKLLKKKNDKYAYKDFKDKLALESNDSLNSSLSSNSDSDEVLARLLPDEEIRDKNDYYQQLGIRDTLRLAVSRHRKNSTRQNSTHTNGLKEKLMKKDALFTGNLYSLPNDAENVNEVDDNDDDVVEICDPVTDIRVPDNSSDDSLEERELRLIALKSAVMKKHMERKRRNAEAAYSPTDFDEMIMNEEKIADIDVVDLEEDDSQNTCATTSPIASPQLMLDGPDDSSQMDCKPVDMDIANSDTEDESANNTWHIKTPSEIPFPPEPPKDIPYPYSGVNRLYMREFPVNATNPPPPGVDDYEVMKQPSMSFGKFQNFETQDMELENEDFEPIVSYPRSTENTEISFPEFKVNSNSASLNSNQKDEDIQEEEELALRALLLSKLQSPKNHKKSTSIVGKDILANEPKTNLETGVSIVKPTEAILKEAVKRLQIHSQVDCRKEDMQKQQTQFNEHFKEEVERDFVPMPMSTEHLRSDFSSYCPQGSNEYCKNLPILALASLQRKAKELKTHNENNTIEKPPSVNGSNISDYKQGVEISEHLSVVSPVASMDEDNKRRLEKLKNDILSVTRGNDMHVERAMVDVEIVKIETESNTRAPKEEIVIDVKDVATSNESLGPCSANCDNSDNHVVIENLQELKSAEKLRSDIDKTLTASNRNNTTNQCEPSKDTVALKENNVNVVNKKNHKTSTEIATIKKPTQEPSMKVVNRTVISNKVKDFKVTPSQSKPLLSTNVVASTLPPKTAAMYIKPTYSVMRTTKIVKPNKVINRNVDTKRKVILIKSDQSAPPPKVMKVEDPVIDVIPKESADDSSRLITSMEQAKHMCNVSQLVIRVQNSSNESSDEEWANCDSMYKPVTDYNDIASPLSLNMESPCLTPVRSNSPVDTVIGKERNLEEKLKSLLKAKQSPVTVKNPENIALPKTPVIVPTQKTPVMTPVAVRHLPPAAQDEYRKLIHRMKLLENQRNKKENVSSNGEKISVSSTSSEATTVESDSLAALSKPSLVRQVLLKNSNNKPSQGKVNESPAPSKAHKANVLRSYESLYVKIGAGIVNNLDKSLRLVEEAKKAKVNKLKLEIRLKELKAEMELLQTKHKEEEQKMSRIYPTICTTNEVITSLKQKRSRVSKSALSLGKALKGDDYRLNNDLKQSIASKTKQLANGIKLVNSLKATNINEVDMCEDVSTETKIEAEENGIEDKCSDKNNESHTKINEEKEQKNEKVDKVSEEDRHSENSGNTEFQDAAPSGDTQASAYETNHKLLTEAQPKTGNGEEDVVESVEENQTDKSDDKILPSYISPLEHFRNCDGALAIDPNGVICPYELMGNCEDATCKYVHISQRDKSQIKPS